MAQTLPRISARPVDAEMQTREKITTVTSSASLYDNVNNTNVTSAAGAQNQMQLGTGPGGKILKTDSIRLKSMQDKQQQNEICQTTPKTTSVAINTTNQVINK